MAADTHLRASPLPSSMLVPADPVPPTFNGKSPFEQVYAEHFAFVWRCLRGLGVRPSHLDDSAQDVFITVYRRLASFRGESSLRSWLYGIVRNVAANHRRSLGRKHDHEPLHDELPCWRPGPHELVADAEAAAFVERFSAGLDEKKREIFLLGVLEEWTMPEVADATGVPLNTVYTRLRSARAEFHAALQRRAARAP